MIHIISITSKTAKAIPSLFDELIGQTIQWLIEKKERTNCPQNTIHRKQNVVQCQLS
jgi:hypothetical protein